VDEHLARVVQRSALARDRNRGRQLAREPETVRERAERVKPDVGDDAGPPGSDNHGPRAGSFHLGDAFLNGLTVA